MVDLDLSPYPTIGWEQFSWLLKQGIPAQLLVQFADTHVVRGSAQASGLFDLDPDGKRYVTFDEGDDFVFWSPASGELASWNGQAFALGADNIMNAGTYAFDNYLIIHPGPISWMCDLCRGIVVLKWNLAFDMLRDVPRVAVSEELLPIYRRHMKPSRVPDVAVMTKDKKIVG